MSLLEERNEMLPIFVQYIEQMYFTYINYKTMKTKM